MPTEKQAYIAELNAIANRYGDLEDTTIKRMLSMVKELRTQIAGEIVNVEGWEDYRRRQLDANLQRLIDEFKRKLGVEVTQAVQSTVEYGGQSVVQPMIAAGIESAFFQPNQALLNTLLDFSAKLVQDIGDSTLRALDQQVRLAALGQKSPTQAMQDITTALGVEAKAGIWKRRHDPVKGIAARAETTLRTEMQRAFNLSTFAQQQDSAARIPGLTKSWVATGDARTRVSHLRAHMRYKAHPIPIDEPFEVGGAKLMYPGDPSGPPEETINCRCRSVTHHPAIGRVGSNLDGRIAQQLQARKA
jgi:hypothetical protein